jgi:hypothetical protein
MVLLDWPPPDHLGIGRKSRQFLPAQAPAEILALGPRAAPPTVAAQTRIVSNARIRLDSRKSVRSFKGIICVDISEFESLHAQPGSSVSLSGGEPGLRAFVFPNCGASHSVLIYSENHFGPEANPTQHGKRR